MSYEDHLATLAQRPLVEVAILLIDAESSRSQQVSNLICAVGAEQLRVDQSLIRAGT